MSVHILFYSISFFLSLFFLILRGGLKPVRGAEGRERERERERERKSDPRCVYFGTRESIVMKRSHQIQVPCDKKTFRKKTGNSNGVIVNIKTGKEG